MNQKEQERVESILYSLSDEAISVLWAWMKYTPYNLIFNQMTNHMQNRGISANDAVKELYNNETENNN